MKETTVNVLGTDYRLLIADKSTDAKLENMDGYCDTSVKKCVVETMQDDSIEAKENLVGYQNSVARHELIHAFLYESGLDMCSWATNEEMVDWLAIQFPKMYKAFKEADAV